MSNGAHGWQAGAMAGPGASWKEAPSCKEASSLAV